MEKRFRNQILKATGGRSLSHEELVQTLWSNYGEILKVELTGGEFASVIIKHVHPRRGKGKGANSISHKRKVRSYLVETTFYERYAASTGDACRVPVPLSTWISGEEVFFVLEDLGTRGFVPLPYGPGVEELRLCLSWLAHFHATFMHTAPEGLWKVGTYWHLATRPEELAALKDKPLARAAKKIDARLNALRFSTFVHGDAKPANFLINEESSQVAAVDFQYVGGGCGMKDVAYLMGAFFSEEELPFWEETVLEIYFQALHNALSASMPQKEREALEQEWRTAFPLAWVDFHRFYKGWGRARFQKESYSEKMKAKVLSTL